MGEEEFTRAKAYPLATVHWATKWRTVFQVIMPGFWYIRAAVWSIQSSTGRPRHTNWRVLQVQWRVMLVLAPRAVV
jgi:hypothetical protein